MSDEKLAYTVNEFCQKHSLSKAYFYRLRNSGLAPKLFYIGSKPLISVEAAQDWRRKMENLASDKLAA